MARKRTRNLLAATAAIAIATAGCTTTGESPTLAGAGGATTVAVTLQEWSVLPASDSAPAGDITFEVTNDGPEDIHEFVILKFDLDPGELPTYENGALAEEGEG